MLPLEERKKIEYPKTEPVQEKPKDKPIPQATDKDKESPKSRGGAPQQPNKEPDNDKEKSPIKIDERNKDHIFRNKGGHFLKDTPENKDLLLNMVRNPKNSLGKDKWGNEWFGKTTSDGKLQY